MSAVNVFGATSQIRNAGNGLFLRVAGPTAIAAGTCVAWYVGELLDAEAYFALDAAGSPRVDYAHAVHGSDFAIAPELADDGSIFAVHDAARLSVGGDIVRSDPTQYVSEATCALGHYANDRFRVQTPTASENVEDGFARSIEAYRERTSSPPGSFAEVRVDWTWRNDASSLADLHARSRGGTAPLLVAFPMALVEAVAAGRMGEQQRGLDAEPVELYLSYGVNYWASRVISPLFWDQKADDDRPRARKLHEVAERILGSEARLSPLPPRFKLAAVDRPDIPTQRDAPAVGEERVATKKPALRLVREDTGEPLTAHETRFVAMAVVGRDPKVLRMPVKLLTLLILRGLVAKQS